MVDCQFRGNPSIVKLIPPIGTLKAKYNEMGRKNRAATTVCSQPLLGHVLCEQRQLQIVVGIVPYRRRQGLENVLAIG
jgi:hypothetical protein